MQKKIFKHTLDNGLTVLVLPMASVPKVSVQLWIHAGSAQEAVGQRGAAHFLEHLLFKGTARLSETDITHVVDKLSGYCNAFTSHDYTVYQFDFPRQHWTMGCDLLADILVNAQFKTDLFNSEKCAVVQELNMYRDDYATSLEEEMIGLMFCNHPYGHPIIGYKRGLWDMSQESVAEFYRARYVPGNASLVVVGAVEPQEAFEQADNYFGQIAATVAPQTDGLLYHAADTVGGAVTLYRDIDQPSGKIGFIVPGAKQRVGYSLDVLAWVLAKGRGSRLSKRLVDELGYATEVDAYIVEMYEKSIFFIDFDPAEGELDFVRIQKVITDELQSIAREGLSRHELERAMNQVKMEYEQTFEDYSELADLVGRLYAATGDHAYALHYLDMSPDALAQAVRLLVDEHFSPTRAFIGSLLPLSESDAEHWEKIQDATDAFDEQRRAEIERNSPLETPAYATSVVPKKAQAFVFPRAQHARLENGCDLLWYNKQDVPLVSIVVDLFSDYYFDSPDKQGCYHFMSRMMLEGTVNYSAQELAQEFERAGVTIDSRSGRIIVNLVSSSLEKALALLGDILSNATFELDAIERVRAQIISQVRDYWDEPSECIRQYAHDLVYKGHPYARNEWGSVESVRALTRDDLLAAYRAYVTPYGAAISVVGDLQGRDVQALIEKYLGSWRGPIIEPFVFPQLSPVVKQAHSYPMSRDQVVLGFVGASVARTDARYDALLLFDYIFTGGSLGSMGSRLFALRDRTGLFYAIGGSLLAGSDEQPGMIFIKTIVGASTLKKVEKMIAQEIDKSVSSFDADDLARAQNAIINGLVEHAASNQQLALSFLFLRRYGFEPDYFDTRAQALSRLSVEQVRDSVRSVVSTDSLATIRIGRV